MDGVGIIVIVQMGANGSSSEVGILDRLGVCFQQSNLCLRPQLQSSELAEFSQRHEYLSLYKDPYYGECHALQSKADGSRCVLVKETLERREHQTRLDRLGEIVLSGEGPATRNIIRACIIADLEKTGFLWRKHELYVSYDYILFDLEKEFQHRMGSNLEFSEAEIRTIIRECTKGFLRLELTRYTAVRMRHIYFCDDGGEIRLAHPRLFNYRSNLQELYEDSGIKNIYLSPEEVSALEVGERGFECGWASNAFSFGMIVLSLMTMKHLNDLYNYQSCEINFSRINELVAVCNNRFSYHLVTILQEMLSPRENQRLTFRNLHNRLDTTQAAGANPVELTLVDQQKPQEKSEEERPVMGKTQEAMPKYPNFIAALIKPKVDLNGEYMSVGTEDQPSLSRQSEIVASQRFRYSTARQGSVGSYMGQALTRDANERGEGVRHGKGVYQYVDGQAYVGQWRDGRMHGFGKLYYGDKKLRYEGEFQQGMFHGHGTEYSEFQMEEREEEIDEEYVKIFQGNWIKYQGAYVNDRKEGVGKIYFKNGFWRGNFKGGQPNGQGIYTSYQKNGVTKGEWKDGILIQRK